MESKKSRVIMLALSGALFGVSALGWWLHAQQSPSTPQVVTAAATPSVVTASVPPVVAQNAGTDVPTAGFAPTEPAKEMFVATKMEDAVRAARESIRRDPLAPLVASKSFGEPAHYSQVESVPAPPHGGFVPPPPAYEPPKDITSPYPQPRYEEPKHDKLLVSDFRLVGTIDGKGIFRIRRDIANHLALPQSFTLGKGECFANVKVQKIDTEHAVVSDGTEVATKELGQIH